MGGGQVQSIRSWPPPTEFWEGEFDSATEGATAPALFKSVLPDTLGVEDVFRGFERIRRAAAEHTPADARVRVYVGEERRDDLIAVVLDAVRTGEEFLPWMQRVLGAERFSLVINNLESADEVLAAELGVFVKAVFQHWGVPIGGCEQVAFAGNYVGTAFGVHQGFEDAFLTHLGPGVKDFYCWSQELYVRLTGTTQPTFGDYERLLPFAQRFPLEAGDVLFLPSRVFHVGVQSELSVSVALPVYTFPLARVLGRSILPEVTERVLTQQLDVPSALLSRQLGLQQLLNEAPGVANDLLSLVRARLDTDLPELVADRWHTMMSNGGWEVIPNDLCREDAAIDALTAREIITPGVIVRPRPPYQLVLGEKPAYAKTVTVYLRGQRLELRLTPELPALLSDLAAGRGVEAPRDAASLDSLQLLYRTGGLHLGDTAEIEQILEAAS